MKNNSRRAARVPRKIAPYSMIRHNMMKSQRGMLNTPQKTSGIISRKQMDRILKEVLAND